MILRFDRTLTARQLVDEIRAKHGGEEGLRRHLKRKPGDALAGQELEDLEYHTAHPETLDEKVSQSISLLPTSGEALAVLTPERLRLLDVLTRKSFSSIRELATFLRRDIHNVHDDLRRFKALGVVRFERGPRNSRIPRVLADTITIVPEEAVPIARRGPSKRTRRRAGAIPR